MRQRNTRLEFMSLLAFLMAAALLLTNGFTGRVNAQDDVYRSIEPIGVVLDMVQSQYVRDIEIDKLVEGALYGILSSLDEHSSFLSVDDLTSMQEDTQGAFEGIGVSIKLDEQERITVFQPIPNSPAAEAGVKPFDIIARIDGVSTAGMTLSDAAERIRGQRGTMVRLTLVRIIDGVEEPEVLEIDVRRDKVPLASVKESRLLEGGIGYLRISDFKQNTASDLEKELKDFLEQGMRAFILDLRWNPGGLLTASNDVCELFLPRGSLVTYTKGREREGRANPEDLELYTRGRPVLPEGFPMIVLVNEQTASSSEIVTGALQYYERALILGEKTFGKGSVQTIIPLERPEGTALRLTTALYYTPGDVTIDKNGILPDIDEEMDWELERKLGIQLYQSYESDPNLVNQQNHGSVTGNELSEETVEDVQLQRAVEILNESEVWTDLVAVYHRDIKFTQMSAEQAKAREEARKEAEAEEAAAQQSEAATPEDGEAAAPEDGEAATPEDGEAAVPDLLPVPAEILPDVPSEDEAPVEEEAVPAE
jgi:carboxyl-terminal processing protease